jgi:hypothetical protein
MGKRRTQAEFEAESRAIFVDRFDYSEAVYRGVGEKVRIRCKEHDEWFEQHANSHLNGRDGCSVCKNLKVGRWNALTQEEFIARSINKHGDRFDYSRVVYVHRDEKVWIRCIEHDCWFEQTAGNHMLGCSSCVQCGGVVLTTEEFIRRATIKHNGKYDYSKAVYVSAKDPIEIICPIHKSFWQAAFSHMSGRGCIDCAGKRKKTTELFITEAIAIHGSRYDYFLVEYKCNDEPVQIICSAHGPFWQQPSNHLSGKGCDDCGRITTGLKRRRSLDEFIRIANEAHDCKYNYSQSVYIDCKTHLTVICPSHGAFPITPDNHIHGWGCPDCYTRSYVSQIEKEWITSLNNTNIVEQHSILLPVYKKRAVIVDGFDPTTNTVYEFNGDFWHGNPEVFDPNDTNHICHKTFGALYQATLDRMAALEAAGYIVVAIWERDFRKSLKKLG